MFEYKAYILKNTELELQNITLDSVPDNHVLVEVHAAGVNRADILLKRGMYVQTSSSGLGLTPGLEFSGKVLEAKNTQRKFEAGERVCGLTAYGAFSELICIHEDLLIRLPETISFTDAATIPEAWGTAWFNLMMNGQIENGELVLLRSAGGGVGLAAIQIAHGAGASVITSAGSDEKILKISELGVHHVFNYKESPLENLLPEYRDSCNLVLDTIGASALRTHLSLLSHEGRMLLIGLLGGSKSEIDLSLLLKKNITLIARTLRSQSLDVKKQICSYIEHEVIPGVAEGKLKLHKDQIFHFSELDNAFLRILSNSNFGNVVLQVR
jgi:NADPH2:quinone reductase